MSSLSRQPVIYELDTWVWLDALGRRLDRAVTLGDVPNDVWDEVAIRGIDAVWLMGVWQRSEAGTRVALTNETFLASFRNALPDYLPGDVVGSPYCVASYAVDDRLGGAAGLAKARAQLERRGLGLVLDYVPNHLAFDHPWATQHPEYFVQAVEGSPRDDGAFVSIGGRAIALGRDPYFPPWPDVIQLNAFSPALRSAATRTLRDIATMCDGVRCDMAMLFVNDVFERTWGALAGAQPADEFWPGVIAAVHDGVPGFTFIAEAYWDMEAELIGQGFDYAYDKRLYDRLVHENAESIRAHLQAEVGFQQHLLRFLENHDEARAASVFAPDRERAAAVITAFLPGGKLYHEGQFEGRRVHNPVPLGRRVDEPVDAELRDFYVRLAEVAGSQRPGYEWRLCSVDGWPDNDSRQNLLACAWTSAGERHVVVVNFSGAASQGNVRLPWDDLGDRTWLLTEQLHDAQYKRDGTDLARDGLFVDLAPWQSHVLRIT